MWFLVIFLVNLVKYTLGTYVFFKTKASIKKVWKLVFFLLFYVIFSTHGDMPLFFMILIDLLFVSMILEGDIVKNIQTITKAAFVILCIDEIAARILTFYISLQFEVSNIPEKPSYIYYSLFEIIIFTLFIFLKVKYVMNKFVIIIRRFLYLGLIIIALSMILTTGGLASVSKYIGDPTLILISNTISILALIGMLVFGTLIVYINNLNNRIESTLSVERFLKKTQEDYYKALLAKEENTRRFRHDINNHLICINELLHQNDIKTVIDYINDMRDRYDEINKNVYNIGNEIIDINLNYYFHQNFDANVKVNGYCSREINVNPIDLCTIFSNLFKNVIEELEKNDVASNPYPFVCFNINTGNENVKFSLINSRVSEKKTHIGNLLVTNKKDKMNHGIGIKNVKDVVMKNHGIFNFEVGHEVFKVEIVLPLKELKDL